MSPLSTSIPIPEEPIHNTEGDDWRLWIGNLDTRVTEYSLLKIIQKFGTLEKFDFLYHKVGPEAGNLCLIKRDRYSLLKIIQKFGTLEKFDFLYHKVGPDAGKPRGYCFVSYKDRQAAEKAMKALNGKLALSKRLAVRWAHKIEGEEDRVKEVNKDTDKGNEELSAQAKIRAIEAKLRHMERTKEEMTLSSKPVVEPGTSIYSSAQKPAETGTSKYPTDERRKGSKPYSRNEKRK